MFGFERITSQQAVLATVSRQETLLISVRINRAPFMGAQSASGARFASQTILRFSAAKNARIFGFERIASQQVVSATVSQLKTLLISVKINRRSLMGAQSASGTRFAAQKVPPVFAAKSRWYTVVFMGV